MSYTATHRFARMSARKIRPIANEVRGKFADEALELLKFMPHRGARLIEQVIKSAVGNAEHKNVRELETLVVSDLRIDQGPMFKRVRPRARGMAFMIKKRSAHITCTLTSIADES
jgi:large subunit ribosomal protein L22